MKQKVTHSYSVEVNPAAPGFPMHDQDVVFWALGAVLLMGFILGTCFGMWRRR